MTRRWGANPQQAKTTHTKQNGDFYDEFYWDKKHRVLFRWWLDRGWVQTSIRISEVSVIEPTTGEGYENEREKRMGSRPERWRI